MPDYDDDLSFNQSIALIQETTAARNLLGYGTRALREAAFLDTTRDPVMTMLSIGIEKAMKMALGLAHVAEHGFWPPKTTFQNKWRHDLEVMNAELIGTLSRRMSFATHPAVVNPLLEQVARNAAWEPLVAALSRYGRSGRFYYLDALADSPQADDDPSAYWNAAELALLESRPDFRELLYGAAHDSAEWDRRTAQLNGFMAEAIIDWWNLISCAGKHRMLGERGAGWGHDFDPRMIGRQFR